MSKVIDLLPDISADDFKDIVQTEDGNYYLVSSVYVPSFGIYAGYNYETMVFNYDEVEDEVDWSEIYCERYRKVSRMAKRHRYIREHLEKVLEEDD